jgi:hypothetical protein
MCPGVSLVEGSPGVYEITPTTKNPRATLRDWKLSAPPEMW